jgi:hypothetical protein
VDSWIFLLIGGLGAIGAALSFGTIAALVQLRRHGTMPGAEPGAEPPGPADVRRLWARIIGGFALAGVCGASLVVQGLLLAPAA